MRDLSSPLDGFTSPFGALRGFSPLSLLAGAAALAWYDPSDLTTMFQDSAGTTPVTASGQPVGLIRDKSGLGYHASQTVSASRPTYTESAGKRYLVFDGVDDFLVTGTITPSVDKVQVFAGLRKLSDAAAQIVAESGTGVSGNTGRFYLAAPAAISSGRFDFLSKGTAQAVATVTGQPTPISVVATGLGDISGDRATLRLNGVQVAQDTTDQGTGNYAANVMYIGRRAGTTLPFNGQLHSLIMRWSSANLTDGQIAQTETWVNQKTGAY